MKESTLVLMVDVTNKLLSEAKEAFYSFTGLMPNKILKVISRYGIDLNQEHMIRPNKYTKMPNLNFFSSRP